MKIFVVIPLFNEENHIGRLLKTVSAYKLPVIVVDDGSKDNSKLRVGGLKLKKLTLLEHKINLGKGAAMKTGADWAFSHGADAIIFMDSDEQHEAEDLPKFVKALESGDFDIVFGTRNYSYGVPLIRFLGNKFASVVIAFFFGTYVSDVLCGFKGITKKAYKKIHWESAGYGVETEMVARMGKNKLAFCEIPIKTIYNDKVKGVTILDAFGIFGEILKWKLTL